jgi:hypothetical protein
MRPARTAMMLLASLPLLAACQTPRTTASALSTDIFEDVPAPRGAVYVDGQHESFSYRARTFRCGLFRYEWSASEADLVRFYKETMVAPPYSWAFAGEEAQSEGSTRLSFTKGDDRCTVDVDRVSRPGPTDRYDLVVRVNYRK